MEATSPYLNLPKRTEKDAEIEILKIRERELDAMIQKERSFGYELPNVEKELRAVRIRLFDLQR